MPLLFLRLRGGATPNVLELRFFDGRKEILLLGTVLRFVVIFLKIGIKINKKLKNN